LVCHLEVDVCTCVKWTLPVVIERKPNDVLFTGRRVGLWRIFRKAVRGYQAPAFRLQPASPVWRGGVTDVGDGKTAPRSTVTSGESVPKVGPLSVLSAPQ
jgi:hypothetical protein